MARNDGSQWRYRRGKKSGGGDGDDDALYRDMWLELLKAAFVRRKLKQMARKGVRRGDGAAQR